MFFKVSAINIDKVNNRLIAKNAIIVFSHVFPYASFLIY